MRMHGGWKSKGCSEGRLAFRGIAHEPPQKLMRECGSVLRCRASTQPSLLRTAGCGTHLHNFTFTFSGDSQRNTTSIQVASSFFSIESNFACTAQKLLESQGDLMSHLKDKVALVTGGSRGIGAGIAKRLAKHGASVALTYMKGADAANKVVKEIQAAGGKAMAIQADSLDSAAVKTSVAKTVEKFGRLDILVNNAGTAIPKPFEEATLEEIDLMFNLNVRAAMVATQAALKHMKEGGRIIMIGSCVGEKNMTPGLAAYGATKGAIKMFTQGLSREVGTRGITVNNVQPGPIDTDLNPAAGDWAEPQVANTALKRYGTADEVATLVAFVAGPDAAYITGANLTVDGGTNA
jgi:3-oxoacyl-[acyl-carrier protein] reductase